MNMLFGLIYTQLIISICFLKVLSVRQNTQLTVYNKCLDKGDQTFGNKIAYYDKAHSNSGEMVINAATITKTSIHTDIIDSVSFLVYLEANGAAKGIISPRHWRWANDFCALPSLESLPKFNIKCIFDSKKNVVTTGTITYAVWTEEKHVMQAVVDCDFKKFDLSVNNLADKVDISLIDESNQLNGKVSFCKLNKDRKIHKIVGCSQPLFNVDWMEKMWPGIISLWVRYHVYVMGYGHFTIYDNDGTVEPFIQDLLKSKDNILTYHKNWAPTKSMAELSHSQNKSVIRKYCNEISSDNQCIWQAKGMSEWAMLMHSPDNWLRSLPNKLGFYKFLDSLPEEPAQILISTYIYVDPNPAFNRSIFSHNISELFIHFTKRRCKLISQYRHLPLIDPYYSKVITVHFSSEPFNLKSVIIKNVSVNHYFTMFNQRRLPAESAADEDTGKDKYSRELCEDNNLKYLSTITI